MRFVAVRTPAGAGVSSTFRVAIVAEIIITFHVANTASRVGARVRRVAIIASAAIMAILIFAITHAIAAYTLIAKVVSARDAAFAFPLPANGTQWVANFAYFAVVDQQAGSVCANRFAADWQISEITAEARVTHNTFAAVENLITRCMTARR